MRRRRLLLLPLLLGAAAIPTAVSASPSGPSGVIASLDLVKPCDGVVNITLAPLQPGQTASTVLSVLCVKLELGLSLRESALSARRGARRAAYAASQPRREFVWNGASLIGQDFDRPNGQTLLVQWFGAGGGCAGGNSYAVGNVGASLNDRFESSRAFSGCSRDPHYRDQYYTGAVMPCGTNCGTLGSMNNQTTSERWTP
jgi:hypothetical protein